MHTGLIAASVIFNWTELLNMIEKVNGILLFPKWFHFFTFDLGKKHVDTKIRTPALNRKTNNGLMNKQQQQGTTGPSKSDVLKSCVTSVVVLSP